MNEWEEFKKTCKKINGAKHYVNSSSKIKNIKINDIPPTPHHPINISLKKNETLGLDNSSNKKLINGDFKIDATLDLHGHTIAEAHQALKIFFERAMLNNFRFLLVITGKGIHSQGETIKMSMEKWLREPYFSNNIIKYTDAKQKHGGTGALYIFLKKNRN
jgi:DNA-nicking Smr family endonuclease